MVICIPGAFGYAVIGRKRVPNILRSSIEFSSEENAREAFLSQSVEFYDSEKQKRTPNNFKEHELVVIEWSPGQYVTISAPPPASEHCIVP